ncbi:hypothetical protein C8J56DRAFT_1066640 [Mycena floridula]|nr:hypothetical protein C8J56DRAFT_1066640 [Mycena floridula]
MVDIGLAHSDQIIPEFDDDLLHLLPSEMFGFNLVTKKWQGFLVEHLSDTLIKGLVAVTKNANSSDGSKIISEVISGESGSLITVLHGPRVPRLDRNALVSVTLRVLEYHSGVLFLTTKSILTLPFVFSISQHKHAAIKFPELDTAGRFTVWSKFLEMAGCKITSSELKRPHEESKAPIFLRKDMEMLALKGFNGQTIKNLMRTSQALALSCEMDLLAEHVMVVVRAQEKFLDQLLLLERASSGHPERYRTVERFFTSLALALLSCLSLLLLFRLTGRVCTV